MYFPYLRGRQYELLALRELLKNNLLSQRITPVIEPVKLSPTLVNTIEKFVKAERDLALISNPRVGTFIPEMRYAEAVENTENSPKTTVSYQKRFLELRQDSSIIQALIMDGIVQEQLKEVRNNLRGEQKTLIINTDRDCVDLYKDIFENNNSPDYVLIPDENIFRRRIKNNRVLLADKFEKQQRNADYLLKEDEFFSDDHRYYKEDDYLGFSDYSIVGKNYAETGFAPYAIAIHIVYFDEDKNLRIKHFVSDDNKDITNSAYKFLQAVTKLAKWHEENKNKFESTKGLKVLLEHCRQETYPGLGTIKKLSLMHHFELMGKYLDQEEA